MHTLEMGRAMQTNHMEKRMNQRGITKQMLDLVFTYGTPVQDKYVLGRKELTSRLAELRSEERALMKLMDKGGVVAVETDNAQITAYNFSSRPHK